MSHTAKDTWSYSDVASVVKRTKKHVKTKAGLYMFYEKNIVK